MQLFIVFASILSVTCTSSLPTHDEWYVVGTDFEEMFSKGFYDYWTIKIERQPSEPKDTPRQRAYIVPVFDKEPCIEDVLARGIGQRLPDSCEQYPVDLIAEGN
jgi:hypothetical protein